MPNIDFYAVGSDFNPVLKYVFEQSNCRVFESYSPFGERIREFKSIEDLSARYIIGACAGTSASVLLQLVTPSSAKLFTIRRVDLWPGACEGHTFRYAVNGWGLIQLYLGGIGPHGIVVSHSNHNSESRARAWQRTYPELRPADHWNWPEITSVSSSLNRYIRAKLAVYKLGARPVLPAAAAELASGKFPVNRLDKDLLTQRTNALYSRRDTEPQR